MGGENNGYIRTLYVYHSHGFSVTNVRDNVETREMLMSIAVNLIRHIRHVVTKEKLVWTGEWWVDIERMRKS